MNKIFNSVDLKHQISTYIIDDICWFNIDKFEFEYYKTFLLTIKDVLLYLKKNKVIYIKQYVFEEDVILFKNSSSTNINENQFIITTNIDIFIDEIIGVFGINII
jgi:hypothetical protein